jgi:hypothetical protein
MDEDVLRATQSVSFFILTLFGERFFLPDLFLGHLPSLYLSSLFSLLSSSLFPLLLSPLSSNTCRFNSGRGDPHQDGLSVRAPLTPPILSRRRREKPTRGGGSFTPPPHASPPPPPRSSSVGAKDYVAASLKTALQAWLPTRLDVTVAFAGVSSVSLTLVVVVVTVFYYASNIFDHHLSFSLCLLWERRERVRRRGRGREMVEETSWTSLK